MSSGSSRNGGMHSKRINCELLAIQFKADGERLGGGGISREAAMEGFDTDAEDFG